MSFPTRNGRAAVLSSTGTVLLIHVKSSAEACIRPLVYRKPSQPFPSCKLSEENDVERDQDEPVRPPSALSLSQPALLTHVADRERPEASFRCGDWQGGNTELRRQIPA